MRRVFNFFLNGGIWNLFRTSSPKGYIYKGKTPLFLISSTLVWNTILHHSFVCLFHFKFMLSHVIKIKLCLNIHFALLCLFCWFSYFMFGFRFKLVIVIVYFNCHVSWKSFCLHSFHAYDTYSHHCMGLSNPMTPINWFAHFICEQKFLIWGSQSEKTIWELESYGVQMGHSFRPLKRSWNVNIEHGFAFYIWIFEVQIVSKIVVRR